MDGCWANSVSNKIWIFWDNTINVSHVVDTNQSSTFWVCVNQSVKCFFTVVYASTDRLVRRNLWVDLLNFTASQDDSPWLVGGDFNAVTCSDEVISRAEFDGPPAEEFGVFLNLVGLMELNHNGNQLSWCNNRIGSDRVSKRLDRVL